MRACLSAIFLLAGCSPSTTFDQTKWKNADLDGRTRADMLPNFIKRYHLKGMTDQQVIDALGPPTTTDKWRGADMIYVLGNDGTMFAIDNEWLLITLDRAGRVKSFERVKD